MARNRTDAPAGVSSPGAGPDAVAQALAAALRGEFRRRILDEAIPRMGRCVALLTPAQLWCRPGPHGNSVGNLLLHLDGNLRQWMLAGLGGETDRRDRDGEFRAEGDPTGPDADGAVLLERLRTSAERADAVLASLTPAAIAAEYRFQDRYTETGVAGIVHVIEHVSGHAYQIYAWTKLVTGQDLAFYDL